MLLKAIAPSLHLPSYYEVEPRNELVAAIEGQPHSRMRPKVKRP